MPIRYWPRDVAAESAGRLPPARRPRPDSKLAPRGSALLSSFARSRPGGVGPDLGAAYGAQAAEIFLDAIARSSPPPEGSSDAPSDPRSAA